MAVKTSWYEADSRFIPGHYQPATLIDLALYRDIDSHRLLRGTGLFHEDILAGTARLSPQQFFGLIGNSRKLLDADDSSFLFGQRLLPGYYGAASHALGHAQNLHQALEILIQQQVLLSPLVTLHLELDAHHAYLYWRDSCGAGAHWRFLLEASMTSLVAMSQWLSGERLPWVCCFSHAEPRYIEQYWVHLGEETRFERPLDMLSIPASTSPARGRAPRPPPARSHASRPANRSNSWALPAAFSTASTTTCANRCANRPAWNRPRRPSP